MTKIKLGHCTVSNIKLSSKSQQAIKDIRSIMEKHQIFTLALGVVPVFDIFLDKAFPMERVFSIGGYDWVQFAKVVNSAGRITKNRIRNISEPMTWVTSGSEQEFWSCISDSSL
ncbi:hypothetical protein N9R79_12145 [Vibrio sp.]|nr:hypothetical protein [Vibrio sp.]